MSKAAPVSRQEFLQNIEKAIQQASSTLGHLRQIREKILHEIAAENQKSGTPVPQSEQNP